MTFNQQYFDATLKHQIDLLRFGTGVARKVNGILDETRADLAKQVERRLGKNTGLSGGGLRRLRELERAIDQTRSPAWNDVTTEWTRTAVDVALEEPLFVAGALTSVLPVELDLVAPSDATLRALATTRPFQGRHLKEWADSARRADLTRIHQQIRIGMVQGESSRDIASRVFGARGATEITRGQAEAVTRTVISGVSNAAQQEFLSENADLFDAEQLVATLDSRTTPICRAQDGKQYPVGKGPIPPLHVACRSIRVAVIDGEVVGERPFKAGTQQQMLREYAEAKGLDKVPKSRDDLPKGSKKDFDAFSRRRMRELTGQVPARTTYQEWLKGQSAAIQDDILGPARGKLFREGGLTLDRFVNRQGDELTLAELRERNREAFERAGVGSPEKKPAQGQTELERERQRADEAERKRREAEERAAAETARRRQEEEARRAAEKAAKEAERRRKADELRAQRERAKRDAEEREREAEFERINRAMAAEQAQKVALEKAAEAALAQHTRAISLADGPDTKYVRIAAETIGRIRPASTAPLANFEIRNAKAIPVQAFGKTVSADGVYSPREVTLRVATELPAHSRPLSDRVFTTGDVAKTREEAFRRLVTHEFGHHIHMSTGFNSAVDNVVARAYRAAAPKGAARALLNQIPDHETDPEGASTRYGTANRYEFWAEAFTSYHHDREWLRANKPVAHKMVEDVLELLK